MGKREVHQIRSKVSGVTYPDPISGRPRQDIIRQYLVKGMRLIAELEPDNRYGEDAVMLLVRPKGRQGRQFHIGYIGSRISDVVAKALRENEDVQVTVTDVTGGTRGKETRGVNILIEWEEGAAKAEPVVTPPNGRKLLGRYRALSRGRRILLICALAITAIILCSVIGSLLPEPPPTETLAEEAIEAPAVEQPPMEEALDAEEVETITTERGEMTVPGTGYLDGRDAEADPPLTVMNINIWDAAERTQVVCELEHGTQIDVLEAEWVEDEERHYFHITGDGCKGWIQAPFISPEYHDSIGDELRLGG